MKPHAPKPILPPDLPGELETRALAALEPGTTYEQLRLDSPALGGAKASSVREVSLLRADLTGTAFVECDLKGADFTGAKLQGADVSASNLGGVTVGPSEVRGLVVSRVQATELARLFGLVVRD